MQKKMATDLVSFITHYGYENLSEQKKIYLESGVIWLFTFYANICHDG